ncbi:MAG TPA: sigma-70 family RNA polymerase sigma factor [Kofleriaceae bacterium]|nr:sigma-70 family RNA polymerase sigma factor [Kofleriaceae bacterium]
MKTDQMLQRLASGLGERYSAVEDRIVAGLAQVRVRWPFAPVGGDALADYLATRLAKLADLTRVPVEDLFLAWWAGSGDSAGIAAFETAFAVDIDRLVARFHKLPADDLRQRLRIKLFVGTGPSPAKIHDYAGSGALVGWLRITATRAFVDAVRADRQRRYEVELDEVDVLGAGSMRDHHQRAELGAAIKRAFAESVSRLAPRERTFLRHVTIDQLTLDQIASTYQVHRATVARTLKSARERLLTETRAGVLANLHIEADQLDSALAMLDSKLDLSLSAVLGESSTLQA